MAVDSVGERTMPPRGDTAEPSMLGRGPLATGLLVGGAERPVASSWYQSPRTPTLRPSHFHGWPRSCPYTPNVCPYASKLPSGAKNFDDARSCTRLTFPVC